MAINLKEGKFGDFPFREESLGVGERSDTAGAGPGEGSIQPLELEMRATMNGDYRTVKCSTWSPGQITEHLRRIRADKPQVPSQKFNSITPPQQVQGSRHYSRRGGEW
ncbi:hypothetical protein J2Z22_001611 [Paenibacillus forsythiae]|uniref:Uncharacterized protein n=1 Tax=Paenibacillus forsythiae TaxID=365616 RepID=A0ABU3H6L6_9BACL|nr:hypothetical protein [Paenibacillus forsythiae]MDT3426091.1 hypothetical protein [Paenibacillus forsythiae]